MVPDEFQSLFASISVDKLDVNKDKTFILQTLLHTATGEAWNWMLKSYKMDEILDVVKNSSSLTPRDVYYWINKYNLPKEQIKCLQINSQAQ